MLPSGVNIIRTNLPNRLELLLRWVCALPKASRMGFACRICRSRRPRRPFAVRWAAFPVMEGDIIWPLRIDRLRGRPVEGMVARVFDREWDGVVGWCTSVAMAAKYWMTFLVLSVFPAPDSPLARCQEGRLNEWFYTHVMRILWFSRSSPMLTHARSATANTWGGFSSRRFPLYCWIIVSE